MPDFDFRETGSIRLTGAVNPDAPPALQSLARWYWELLEVDDESGDLTWRFKTANLDFSLWSGTAHYAAAAGGVAEAEDFVCGTCGGPLKLASRQTLVDAVRGNTAKCRSCNGQVDKQAVRILSAEGMAKRAVKVLEGERFAAEQQSLLRLEADRRT
jgi:hypothetical protein